MFDSLRRSRKFSLNDPQWGHGSPGGPKPAGGPSGNAPPDLDQLWRDFNESLAKLFGKGRGKGSGGRGNGNSGGTSNLPSFLGIGALLFIAALIWLATGFFTVQEGQTGVVTTFGKYSHSTGSGFNWRWPAPIQGHEIVNVSGVRTIEVGYRGNARNKELKESLMLTEDENIIDIQFAVQYRLKDAADWVFNNRDPEETVRQVAETAIREVVGKNEMDFVLYEGREKIALDVNLLMQQILDRYKTGVQITNVTMQGVQPPEQVQAAFDDAVKAGQDRERQKNEGQAYANDVIPKAHGAASRLLQEAEAYSARVVANAEGDASRFSQVVAEYQKAPVVTRDRLYLETMQQIFANTAKVMMDAKNGNSLMYLPLDKLMSSSLSGAPAEQGATQTHQGPPGGAGTLAPLPGANNANTPFRHDPRGREREER